MQLGSGLEAIAFQRTRSLFVALTAEINSIMKSMAEDKVTKLETPRLKKSNLSNILQAGSGFLSVTLVVDERAPINAYTYLPTLTADHAFYNDIRREASSHADAYSLYLKLRDVIKGQIDLETGLVAGDFAKIPLIIGLGWGMFDPKYGFLAEEIAAVLLHEQGHDFTYCYALHYTCATNMVLACGVQAIVAADDTKQKHAIMTDLQNTLGIKIDNMDELTNYDKYEDYYITMLSAYRKKVYSALGSSSYDLTMAEQMADQYAARHGAGRYLVTGMAKMDKIFIRPKRNFVIKLLTFAICFPFMALNLKKHVRVITGVFTNDFLALNYDADKDRFVRVRNESVTALKNPALSNSEKKVLLEDLAVMDEIIKDTSNADWSMSAKLAFLLRSSQREQFRSKRLQQELEALLNNPLYIAAAKYSL